MASAWPLLFLFALTFSSQVHGQNEPFEKNLDQLIASIVNITKFTKPTKGTTTTSTTLAPTAPTPPTPTPCTCGTGGRPNPAIFNNTRSLLQEFGVNNKDVESRVVLSVQSNRTSAWPWMAAIFSGFSSTNSIGNYNVFCGGTLISPQFVLTAASCFNGSASNAANFGVLLGTSSISSKVGGGKSVSRVAAITIHPKFNASINDYDVALVKLAVPLNISATVRPICLGQGVGSPSNRNGIVTGWGLTNVNPEIGPQPVRPQTLLREALMRTIPNENCSVALGGGVTKRMICAKGFLPFATSGPCKFDGGGPLMLYRPKSKTYTLLGIVSRDAAPPVCGGGAQRRPSVFTRVANALNFIKGATNGTSFCSNSFS